MISEADKVAAKVVAVFGKHIKVYCQAGYFESTIRGKILQSQLESSPVAVGDNVKITIHKDGTAAIEEVLPRRHSLYRPSFVGKKMHQVMASNLDQVIIVSSTQDPKFKPGLVDRFLISAELLELEPVIIINKIDLQAPSNFQEYSETWGKLGYPVLFASAKTKQGLDGVIAVLKDKTSTFAGHSGVGKSSLLNAIQPALKIKTREISKASGRGVHTTTSVMMYPLDFGGWVADTPGLKIFGLAETNKLSLKNCFPEFIDYEQKCRFADCQHRDEPDCAVKAAMHDGLIAGFRYKSYIKMWEQLAQ